MHTDNIHRLIDVLLTVDDDAPKFDMGSYLDFVERPDVDHYDTPLDAAMHCGTVACIAGWSYLIQATDFALIDRILNWGSNLRTDEIVFERARQWLGLTEAEAKHIFLGNWHPDGMLDLSMVTIEETIDMLTAWVQHPGTYPRMSYVNGEDEIEGYEFTFKKVTP